MTYWGKKFLDRIWEFMGYGSFSESKKKSNWRLRRQTLAITLTNLGDACSVDCMVL